MSSLHPAADVPLHIVSEQTRSERRVSPAWTLAQLRAKLEPITGVPAAAQVLSLRRGRTTTTTTKEAAGKEGKHGEGGVVPLTAGMGGDEDAVQLVQFGLVPYAEIHVQDSRPASMRQDYNDVSNVPKYVMPSTTYEALPDSVLAWKKANKLGRFAEPSPEDAPMKDKRGVSKLHPAIARSKSGFVIQAGHRCRIDGADAKRGVVMHVGPVPEIPSTSSHSAQPDVWIGIRLDEPVGKNDGSIGGKRYWKQGEDPPSEDGAVGDEVGGAKYGIFVRSDRVEVGDEFTPLGLDGLDDDLEEI